MVKLENEEKIMKEK